MVLADCLKADNRRTRGVVRNEKDVLVVPVPGVVSSPAHGKSFSRGSTNTIPRVSSTAAAGASRANNNTKNNNSIHSLPFFQFPRFPMLNPIDNANNKKSVSCLDATAMAKIYSANNKDGESDGDSTLSTSSTRTPTPTMVTFSNVRSPHLLDAHSTYGRSAATGSTHSLSNNVLKPRPTHGEHLLGRSASIPVKKDPCRRFSAASFLTCSANVAAATTTSVNTSNTHDNKQQLQKIYDMRTWNMYTRITEARMRAAKRPSCSIAPISSKTDNSIAAEEAADETSPKEFRRIGSKGALHSHNNNINDADVFETLEDDACSIHSVHSTDHDMVFALDE